MHAVSRAVVLTSLLLLANACSRVEIDVIASGEPVSDADPSVVAMHLSPEWLAAASLGPLPDDIAERLRLQWQASMVVTQTLADGTEVLLPDLTAELEVDQLDIRADDGRLAVDATYQSAPMRVSLRFKQSAGDTFCRIDLELGPRDLSFDITPSNDQGVVSWPTQLRAGLTTETPLAWTPVESCPIDLQTVDWSLVESLIDADLTAQASSTFVPAVRDLVIEELALPRAGLELRPLDTGFYAPSALTAATRVAAQPPWVGGGIEIDAATGLRVALDTRLTGQVARCAGALEDLPTAQPAALRPHGTPDVTPTRGEAWATALALDAGFADRLLQQLAASGHLCGELEAPTAGGLPRLEILLDELRDGGDLDYERRGRVRIQPTGQPHLTLVDTDTVRVTLDGLRLEVYGEAIDAERDVDGLLVRLALVEGRFVIEGRPTLGDDGTLSLTEVSVTAELRDSEVTALEATGATVDPEAVSTRLVSTLAERVVRLPMPRPFGRALELIELEERDGALWMYLGFR